MNEIIITNIGITNWTPMLIIIGIAVVMILIVIMTLGREEKKNE